jgi:U3 small nucleolar RNA-associated protein 13
LAQIIGRLHDGRLSTLLEYIKEWNTRAKHSFIVHEVLRMVLGAVPGDRLMALPAFKAASLAIVPYTQRHLERMDRTLQSTYLLNYTLHAMQRLTAGAEVEAGHAVES